MEYCSAEWKVVEDTNTVDFNGVIIYEVVEWRDIKGYDGRYKINEDGVIKSFINGREHTLKHYINKYGYPVVGLSMNGVSKTYQVHRLVAEAFIPNPNNYPVAKHKNDDKGDPRAVNLKWVSYYANRMCSIERKRNRLNRTTNDTKVILNLSSDELKDEIKNLINMGYSKDKIINIIKKNTIDIPTTLSSYIYYMLTSN